MLLWSSSCGVAGLRKFMDEMELVQFHPRDAQEVHGPHFLICPSVTGGRGLGSMNPVTLILLS